MQSEKYNNKVEENKQMLAKNYSQIVSYKSKKLSANSLALYQIKSAIARLFVSPRTKSEYGKMKMRRQPGAEMEIAEDVGHVV